MKLLQTDPRLLPEINKEGCHFMSLLGIAQDRAEMELCIEQVLEIYKTATVKMIGGRPLMRADCYLFWPQHVINLGLSILGDRRIRFDQVGSFTHETQQTHWWSLGSRHHRFTDCILEGLTERGNHHFRQGDRNCLEVYNPDPEAKIANEIRRVFYLPFDSETGRSV